MTKNMAEMSATTDTDLKGLLIWNDEMEIGLPQIDRQHKKLHELLLRCLNVVDTSENHSSIKNLLDELVEYTQCHFRDEEIIMQACGYAFLENHREVHKMLVKQVNKQIQQFEQGVFSTQSLLLLLQEWFVEHNMGMDRAVAECAKGKEAIIDKALKNSKNQFKDD